MSDPHRKDRNPAKDGLTDTPDDDRSGRISYDERGNSIWEWKLDDGEYSRDISTQRLKKLDLNELSLAETARHPRPPGLGGPAPKPLPGGGFNPYDNSSTARGNIKSVGGNPYNNAGRASLKPEPPSKGAGSTPRKPMDLKRLEEWMAIKRRVEQNKREEGDE